MKIFHTDTTSIPSIKEILELTKNEHLVLEFPKAEILPEIETELVTKLKSELPENYTVFKSGVWAETITFTVKRTLKTQDIKANLTAIKECITDYITISNKLFNNKDTDKSATQNWVLVEEHGEHNRYQHKNSGQILETCAFLIDNITQIDPYFFGVFIKTGTKYANIQKIITNEFHDSALILDYVKENAIFKFLTA